MTVQALMPGLLLISVAIAAILVYLPFFAVGYARFAVGYDESAPDDVAEAATLRAAGHLSP
jgi:uncharacterized MAPEG superfamily protein